MSKIINRNFYTILWITDRTRKEKINKNIEKSEQISTYKMTLTFMGHSTKQ